MSDVHTASTSLTLGRFAKRHAWTVGVWILLGLLVLWYATLVPRFGGFETASIVRSGLPLAFLALAQAAVVIGGGIDLGVGALLILGNVLSAKYMLDQDLGTSVGIAIGVVAVVTALNALVGLIIARSGVPDIVVTLATLFIFGGLALAILPSPGGGMTGELRWVFTGSEVGIGQNPWPPLILLIICATGMWYLLRHRRTGLSIYAMGSSRQAAFLTGVDVVKTKVISYALAGGFAAMAGLATTAITGTGDPRFSIALAATLNSVAAIVLGGIALTGGVGSALGAVAAGYAFLMLSPIMTSLRVDPNQAQVVQGILIVLVVMVGGLWRARREADT